MPDMSEIPVGDEQDKQRAQDERDEENALPTLRDLIQKQMDKERELSERLIRAEVAADAIAYTMINLSEMYLQHGPVETLPLLLEPEKSAALLLAHYLAWRK